jgi:ABC-type branched-subunit amino acid transport system permease subunit
VANFFLQPITPFLVNVEWHFLPAMLAAGLLAGMTGLLIGAPALRLHGDYLAIATLGFGEIIAEGPPQSIQNDQRVVEACLGVGDYAGG